MIRQKEVLGRVGVQRAGIALKPLVPIRHLQASENKP
jgi:hypothetical protein